MQKKALAKASSRKAARPDPQMQAVFEKGLKSHQQGDFDEAERIYRWILNNDPRHFDATHLLGVLALERGQPMEAEKLIRHALEIRSDVAAAHNNFGTVLQGLGRYEEAVASHGRAIKLNPKYAEAYNNRGNALRALDRLDEAIADFQKAVALKTQYAQAHDNLGAAFLARVRYDEAAHCFRKAIQIEPRHVQAHWHLGNVMLELKQPREAIACFDTAISLDPRYAIAYNNRGNALQDLQRYEEAIKDYDAAIAIDPKYAQAHNNRGNCLYELKRHEEAIASFDKAIALQPRYYDAFRNRGFAELILGRFTEGWRDYDYRWKTKDFPSAPDVDAPLWLGESLKGRSILVYAEQGVGDVAQFCRYLPLLAERGAKVRFFPFRNITRILRSLKGGVDLDLAPAPEGYDFKCPLMSLPRHFGTELSSIPSTVPYLFPEPERIEAWRSRIGSHGYRIGISWQGKAGVSIDRGRSAPLAAFLPLARIPGVRLISLQKNAGTEQLANLPQGMSVETLGDDFDAGEDGFVDTLAVMSHLDLIVTVDTAIAHLAGASARPTWVALKYVPEWRWLLDREDSPWYPTMRLFRQKSRGDWTAVFTRMAAELRKALNVPSSPVGRFVDVKAALAEATKAYQRADLNEAERLYRLVLETDPDNFEATHMLGLLFLERGEYAAAERQIALAVGLDPRNPSAHNNRGVALKELNRLFEALASYDRAIVLKRTYAEAFNNRGVVLRQLRHHEEAIASYDKAIALKLDYADAYHNRGNALLDLKRFDEAQASRARAIRLKPGIARPYSAGDMTAAAERFATMAPPVALAADDFDRLVNRGIVQRLLRRPLAALAAYDAAIALRSDNAEVFNNRGNALQDLKRSQEAIRSFNKAIALRNDYPDAHVNRAYAKLAIGDFAGGWPDYEQRWRKKGFERPPKVDAAPWRGEELCGRSILVYTEQGIGDTFQFCRYLPLLVEKGARVTLLAPANLQAILTKVLAGIEVTSSKEPGAFDFQCPLLSLPYRFGTDLSNIPAAIPYLAADPQRLAAWREKIGNDGFRIGVCWHSKPVIPERSFPLVKLHALARIPGVRLISLQKSYGLEQLSDLPADMTIETLGEDFDSGKDAFVDTAAVMECLDLIITSDTSVAHLAGALGRPTFVALCFSPDWRWMFDRADSPWYPTLRLFRQPEMEDWASVFAEVTQETRRLVAARLPAPAPATFGGC